MKYYVTYDMKMDVLEVSVSTFEFKVGTYVMAYNLRRGRSIRILILGEL